MGSSNYANMAANMIYIDHIVGKVNHIYDTRGGKLSIDKLLHGKEGPTRWIPELINKWGRLAQGNDAGLEYIDTIRFIKNEDVPHDKKLTYASFVCNHRPLKD